MIQDPDSANNPLNTASTVAIIVHGVGDHSAPDILAEAKRGFSYTGISHSEVSRVTLHGLPGPQQLDTDHEGLCITENNETHIVLPILWNIRARVATPPKFISPTRPDLRFAAAISAVISLCGNALACVRNASGLGLLIVLLAAILLPVITLAAWGMNIYLFSWLIFTFLGSDTVVSHWYNGVVGILAIAFLGWVNIKFFAVLDLIGDVTFYVGRGKKRAQLEKILEAIITSIAHQAPNARILLVGHSLGSVLIANSLLHMPVQESLGKRIVLITLGSPLLVMSFIFRTIDSPRKLAADLCNSGRITFWINLWRDRDFVGRSLSCSNCTNYSEQPIGDGPHWNYWSAPELWTRIIALLGINSADDLMRIQKEWAAASLNDAEEAELNGRRRIAGIALMLFVPFGLFVIWLGSEGAGWSAWPFPAFGLRDVVISTLWWLNLVSVLGMYLFATLQTRNLSQPRREFLGQLRFWTGPFWFALWTSVLTAASLGLLDLQA